LAASDNGLTSGTVYLAEGGVQQIIARILFPQCLCVFLRIQHFVLTLQNLDSKSIMPQCEFSSLSRFGHGHLIA